MDGLNENGRLRLNAPGEVAGFAQTPVIHTLTELELAMAELNVPERMASKFTCSGSNRLSPLFNDGHGLGRSVLRAKWGFRESLGVSAAGVSLPKRRLEPPPRPDRAKFSVAVISRPCYLTVRPNGADHQWKEDPSMVVVGKAW